LLECHDLKVTHARSGRGIAGVSLKMEEGILGLVGPNGSGKSTLMRCLATTLEPTAGSALICGFHITSDRRRVRRLIGYLPQDFGVLPALTPVEFLDYLLLYHLRATRAQRLELINRALQETGLWGQRDLPLRAFSGGMKQRLGIAQALLTRPRVLLIDEPSAGLDPEERIRLRVLLARLAQEHQRLILIATHIIPDIEHTAKRIALMNDGRLEYFGPAAGLVKDVKGKVWEAQVPVRDAPYVSERFTVVRSSEGATVDTVRFRIISDEAPRGTWQPVAPGLEDGYLWHVRRQREGAPGP